MGIEDEDVQDGIVSLLRSDAALMRVTEGRIFPHRENMACERCGNEAEMRLYGVCADCIHGLIQADKARTPPGRSL